MRNTCVIFLLLLTQYASADVITMKNGDKITGSIKKIWDKEVFIEPDYADEFSVDQDQIVSIEADEQYEIRIDDNKGLLVTFKGSDADGNQIVEIDGQESSVSVMQIKELVEIEDYFDWSTRADLNSTFNSGNTNNSNLTLTADLMLKWDRQKHLFDLLWQNEDQKIEGITTTVKDRERFRYNFNYDVNDPWFAGAFGSWESDPIKGLDYRYNMLPMAGYSVWNDAGRTLNFQLGAGYQAEKNTDELGITTEDDGAIASFVLRFDYDLGDPDIELYLNNTTTAAFYGRDNVVTQFNVGTRYEITDLLYLNLEFLLDYESEPVEGSEPEDISVLFGFGLEFEK
jgi:putative salt-induced outer membrane protein YdiY